MQEPHTPYDQAIVQFLSVECVRFAQSIDMLSIYISRLGMFVTTQFGSRRQCITGSGRQCTCSGRQVTGSGQQFACTRGLPLDIVTKSARKWYGGVLTFFFIIVDMYSINASVLKLQTRIGLLSIL